VKADLPPEDANARVAELKRLLSKKEAASEKKEPVSQKKERTPEKSAARASETTTAHAD